MSPPPSPAARQQTSANLRRQRQETTFLELSPANPYCPSFPKTFGGNRCVKTHAERPPLISRHRRSVLPHASRLTAGAFPRACWQANAHQQARIHRQELPVSPFVGVLCARHHPLARSRVPTALRGTSLSLHARSRQRAIRLLLRPHSPSTAFETRRRPGNAPGTTPEAIEAPALAILLALRITSLSRVTGRDEHRLRTSPEAHTV